MRVYFNEYNIPMSGCVYLPLVSGMLSAYAKTFPEITERYEFMRPLYKRQHPNDIVSQYDNPDVAAFSVSLWNYELSLAVARRLKSKFPECITIFGGPNAPFKNKPDGVDHVVNGEGEKKFVNILFEIAGIETRIEETQEKDLDVYPSPYATGEFDKLLDDDIEFQAIIETNRGCPFLCSFCFWGQGGLNKRFRFHGIDYIKSEMEWIAKKKIKYVFCADSNFGMFNRDTETAKAWSAIKQQYGYPEKVRVCYGKNAEESIFQTAKVLNESGLCKSVTLSKQTDNKEALKHIKRTNIKSEVYHSLQRRYLEAGISTYTELLLGLPGETLESFKEGVHEALTTETQLFIYCCTVLPNTEMADPEYQVKHGIKTARVELTEIHTKPKPPGFVKEYEDIIIETSTMTTAEWLEALIYSWRMQAQYVFGVPETYLDQIAPFFYATAEWMLIGRSRGRVDPKFGDIIWEPEELAYLWYCEESNLIKDDPEEFAKREVLFGRKSKVGRKKLIGI